MEWMAIRGRRESRGSRGDFARLNTLAAWVGPACAIVVASAGWPVFKLMVGPGLRVACCP